MSAKSRPTAHALFEVRVAAQPDSVALLYRDQSITYSELNQRANRLAHLLIRRGLGPGVFVGIYLEPSIDAIVAILAILKAGGAYVPLESSHPPTALAAIIQQAGLSLVLTNSDFAWRPPESLCLDLLAAELDAESTANPKSAAAAASPAAAFYTSGSTGEPKGVARLHGNIPIKLLWATFGPEEVYAFHGPLSVSLSISRIFQPLLGGAPLVIVPGGTVADITRFAVLLETHKVTNVSLAPSHLRALLDAGEGTVARLSHVRTVAVGGSVLGPELIRRFAALLPGVTLVNHYATSETGPCLLGMVSSTSPPSGFPVEGCTVHLLDPRMRPVEDGVAGEIFVESPWLPRGYLNRPDLTAERFIPNPFDAVSGERCFRTGDLGRRLPDGSIEVLGRADDRVNIRGFLVEPVEIESALREYPGVREAAVRGVEVAGEMRLAAYLVPQPGAAVSPHQLRRFLAQRIPAHKIPSAFVLLASLPLTAGGKLDRRALPNPSLLAAQDASALLAEPPSTPSEILLAKMWEEAFGFGPICRSAHFFDLGGDSLTAMVVAARVQSECAVALDMRTFTARPLLSELAAEVDRLRGSAECNESLPITSVAPDEACPLSFAQEAIWTHIHHSRRNAKDFAKARAYQLSGPLNIGALEAAIHWIVMRHDILRTMFRIVDGKPVQIVTSSAPEGLAFDDLSSLPDPGARASEMLAAELTRPFDLAAGPLIRQRLVKIGTFEHRLLHVNHHIISDRWSWTLYVNELSVAYEAFAGGSVPPPLSKGVQYRDYASWERRVLAPGTPFRARMTEWWRKQASGRPRDRYLPLGRRFPFGKPLVADSQRRRHLDPDLISRIETLSIREGTTYFTIGLAALAALLADLKRHPSVTIGVYIYNRWRPDLQGVLGDFTSLVPVCLHCDPALPFREWLLSVRETLVNAQTHAQLPISQFRHDLQAGGIRPPEVHAIVLGSVPDRHVSCGALEISPLPYAPPTSMPWGLTVVLKPLEDQQPYIEMEFDARLYQPAKAHRLFERFHRLLDRIASDPDGTVREVLNRS